MKLGKIIRDSRNRFAHFSLANEPSSKLYFPIVMVNLQMKKNLISKKDYPQGK